MRGHLIRASVLSAALVASISLSTGSAIAQTADEERIRLLEEQLKLIQQQLLEMQRELQQTRAAAESAKTTAVEAQEQADEVKQAQVESGDGEAEVTSGQPKVKLSISGHINRAVNLANDGDQTKAYFVDNDTSNSRFRFEGTGDVGDGTTLGTRIEIAVSPNNSFDVSQDNEDAGDNFDQRKVEVFARNDEYGRLSLGKGATASEDTAEYDLSLVAGPIMYSGVSDIVGGLEFTDGNNLLGFTLGDAFFNFDGLGREDRVLYESPVFGPGLQLATSAGADQKYDAAVTWGGDYGDWSGVQIGDILTLGALAISDPNDDAVDYRVNGSASFLHLASGVGFTFSAGTDRGNDDPYNLYGKLSWDTEIFDFGQTGFGVDYTFNEDVCGQCDEGQSAGLAAVQTLEDWGVELYSQVRWFTLDTASGVADADDLVVGTVGARAKF